jgi:hypothetical protein
MPSPTASARGSRRLLLIVLVVGLLGIPAAALHLGCAFNACAASASGGSTAVPFCPLPAAIRDAIVAGFRDKRSPDVMGVTTRAEIVGGSDPTDATLWPSLSSASQMQVPIVFAGAGVSRRPIPDGTGLDQIAPTVADAIGLKRAHPEVRAGVSVPGVVSGATPPLVVEVAWKGIGTSDLAAAGGHWPELRTLMDHGAGTTAGTTGSLPADPAATLTTIGTGGPPFQHGITGSLIRNDDGVVVAPWSQQAPPSVIATLGDDLDHALARTPEIGIVETAPTDRGLIGGTWYQGKDDDTVTLATGAAAQERAVASMLSAGFGADATPDLLGVVMQGPVAALDRELRRVVAMTQTATHGRVLIVVAGTGAWSGAAGPTMSGPDLLRAVDQLTGLSTPPVQAAVPGGVFLDEAALIKDQVTGQVVQDAFLRLEDTDGAPVMAEAFQSFAVSFSRYC